MLGERDSGRQNWPVLPFAHFEFGLSFFPSVETTGGKHWTGSQEALFNLALSWCESRES